MTVRTKPLIQEPTHSRGHTLDLLIVRDNEENIGNVALLSSAPSDHAAITFTATLSRPQADKRTIVTRNLRDVDYTSFRESIDTTIERASNLDEMDVNAKVELYNSTLSSTLDEHAPAREKEIQLRPHAPWYDNALRSSKQKVRRSERKWRKSNPRSTAAKAEMQEAVTEYNRLLKISKCTYHRELIKTSDNKGLFQVVKRLTVERPDQRLPSHTSKSKLAQDFLKFFDDKIANLRTQFENLPPPTFANTDILAANVMQSFKPVSEDDILKLVKSTEIKSCTLDPIPAQVFKECLPVLLPAIADIINQSLQAGVFPTSFKSALIIPTLKKPNLDPDCLGHYRPISNLPFVSKVLERVVCQQLLKHLHENSLLASRQSAYRPSYSVETALTRVQNDLLQSLDDGNEGILVLLDLSSAFDTLDHGMLLHRLKVTFGVSGIPANWFASYLHDREQRVIVDGELSEAGPIHWGVPQGSVIGPLLFICYTTPLQEIIEGHGVSCMMYADDLQLYVSAKTGERHQAIAKLEACLHDVRCWMKTNQLVLNDSKTEVLHVTSHKKRSQEIPPVNVGETQVSCTGAVRDLGVTLDSHLSLRQHINTKCRNASFALYRIGKVRHLLDKQTTEILVHSFVSSLLDNCNSLLFDIPKKDIAKLQRIQNSAARLVSRSTKRTHITPVLKELHWLPISSRIQYKLLITTFKAIHGTCPSYLSELITPYVPARPLRSSSQHLLTTPAVRTKSFGSRTFSSAAPRLWNSLPSLIRSAQTIEQFKSQLKSYLFSNAF